jgi:hypothetical protein
MLELGTLNVAQSKRTTTAGEPGPEGIAAPQWASSAAPAARGAPRQCSWLLPSLRASMYWISRSLWALHQPITAGFHQFDS